MSNVDFVLNGLNYDVTMLTAGSLSGEAITTLDASAVAVIDVAVGVMQDAFSFHSDSLDFTNTDADDVIYYVNWPETLVINSSDAIISSGSIGAVTSPAVKHDFIRHIAEDLFNTHHGVDLFDNEEAMVQDLVDVAEDQWSGVVTSVLTPLTSGANNSNTQNTNLGRVLYRQLVNAQPARFNDGLVAVDGETNKFKMPFVAGDSISFLVTYNAASGQQSIIGRAEAVPARTYQIKLNMTA